LKGLDQRGQFIQNGTLSDDAQIVPPDQANGFDFWCGEIFHEQ